MPIKNNALPVWGNDNAYSNFNYKVLYWNLPIPNKIKNDLLCECSFNDLQYQGFLRHDKTKIQPVRCKIRHMSFKLMDTNILQTFDTMRWQGNFLLSADWLIMWPCLYKMQDIKLRGICKSKWEKFLLLCFFLPAWWPSPPVSLSSHHYFWLCLEGFNCKRLFYDVYKVWIQVLSSDATSCDG